MLTATLNNMAAEADTSLDIQQVHDAAARQAVRRQVPPWAVRSAVLISAAAALAGVFLLAQGSTDTNVVVMPAASTTTAASATSSSTVASSIPATTTSIDPSRCVYQAVQAGEPIPNVGQLALYTPRSGQEFNVGVQPSAVFEGRTGAGSSLYLYESLSPEAPPVELAGWVDKTSAVNAEGSFMFPLETLNEAGPRYAWVRSITPDGQDLQVATLYIGVDGVTCY
jgi:hypothetical protein